MTAATLRRDPGNAFVAIAALARSFSNPALVGIETLGLAASLALFIWLPQQWQLTLPCLALGSFGLWGVCDRYVASRPGHRYRTLRKILRVFQSIIAGIGIAALLLGGYALVGWVMGVYIS
jgi:hypothetical protein